MNFFNIFQNKVHNIQPEVDQKSEVLQVPVHQELEDLKHTIHQEIHDRWGKHHYEQWVHDDRREDV